MPEFDSLFITKPTAPMPVQTVTLEGDLVRLEPLTMAHVDALCEVGLDPAIWTYYKTIQDTPEAMRRWVQLACDNREKGTDLPFVVYHKAQGRYIGSTRYLLIERHDYRLDIGSTWYGTAWQRTGVNTECKYLLMTHAFETLGCYRVGLVTDSWNERSRAAILRIGAQQEGILRNHVIMSDGRLRHTVSFSVLHTEWPSVKTRLEGMMRRD